MEKYDFMPSLGRFTLRDEGKYSFFYLGLLDMEKLQASNPLRSCLNNRKLNWLARRRL